MAQQLQPRGEDNPDVEENEIAHLAGVLDAVGTVTVHVSKNDKYSIGYQYQAVVRIIRPMDDSDPIMGKLMAYCDELGVRTSISEKSHGPDRDSQSYELHIKNPDSIRRFLEPMVPYLVTKYEPVVIMLEQIVPRLEDGLHRNKEGFYELMEFADMIREDNRRGTELKYTQSYFEDEWSIAQ
jgi:hypothetical protein